MSEPWIESLVERARVCVSRNQHDLARDLTQHDRACPTYVTAECTVAVAGYTATAFMVAWSSGEIPEC